MKFKLLIFATMFVSQHTIAQGLNGDINFPYTWTTSENPIAKHMYCCDPSAKVFSDGKVWVVTSHDADNAKSYATMLDYHVYSTEDLKTWTDHGRVMGVEDVTWAESDLWAPDFVERNGKYYIYTPAGKSHRIGVFVSDKPEGPYKDALGKPLIPMLDAIDPMVFIDDDGQAYMYFSRRGKYCYVVKLKDNMTEIDGEIVELTNKTLRTTKDGDFQFVEGPFVHKRGGNYYLTYAAKMYKHGEAYNNHFGDEVIAYAMSKNPMGPFTAQGVISDFSGIHTIHQAVVNLNGQDYMFYHNGDIAKDKGETSPVTNYRRSMCVNKLHYNDDGTIVFFDQNQNIFH